jgi:hypothetical protein
MILLQLFSRKGKISCEAPNNKLHKFEGALHLQEQLSMNNDALVLRVSLPACVHDARAAPSATRSGFGASSSLREVTPS